MTDQQNALAPFIQRREKNLAYFKEEFKDIYELFKDYRLKDLQLNILTEEDEVNLIKDGVHVYEPGAKEYSYKEVESFRAAYCEGKKIYSFAAPIYSDYEFPRFGQLAVSELLKKSPIQDRVAFPYYQLEDFYPLVVFLGCGLGYHIEKMVNDHNVQNMIVVEPNLDTFAASLYSVDWAEICSKYSGRNGKTMHFIIGAEESEYILWAITWNRLIDLSPHFPVATLFYNHQRKDLFDRVSDKVNADLLVFLLSWGHYDDEIRQLNNALHNFHRGVKELPKTIPQGSHTPVFIVGAGPSLDDRIDYIKQVKDKAIIISCGTALKSLYTHGLKPDIHVELESDLLAYIAVSQAADESFYKDIKLVGPTHISPLIFKLFGDGRMYYKAESSTSHLFAGEHGHVIQHAVPTCTNLGVGLAVAMGFKNIFLFGLDFGFKDIAKHHSSGSIYYEKLLKLEHEQKDLIKIEAVDGEDAWTTPNYFASKRKVENVIQAQCNDEDMTVYNCSGVAKIEGAEWLQKDEFIKYVNESANTKADDMAYMFSPEARTLDLSIIQEKLKSVEFNLEALSRDLTKLLREPVEDLESMSTVCAQINWYLEVVLKNQAYEMYFFVRGAIRHYLCAGFSHAFAITDKEARLKYLDEWKIDFKAFFDKVPDHYRSVVYKEFNIDTDPWMKQSIYEPEDGINPFFTENIEDLRLHM